MRTRLIRAMRAKAIKTAVRLPGWAAWLIAGLIGLSATQITAWAWKVETTQDDHERRLSVRESQGADIRASVQRVESKVDRVLDHLLARPSD